MNESKIKLCPLYFCCLGPANHHNFFRFLYKSGPKQQVPTLFVLSVLVKLLTHATVLFTCNYGRQKHAIAYFIPGMYMRWNVQKTHFQFTGTPSLKVISAYFVHI